MRPEQLILLDPTIGDDYSEKRMATRLKSFEGKVLGLLWNSKPGGDVLLQGVGARLASKAWDSMIADCMKDATKLLVQSSS